MAGALGLVGGGGRLPALMAREARREGWRVVAFALVDPASLAECADRVVPCRLGDVGPVLETLSEESIRHVVLAGRVSKEGLFQGMELDERANELVGRAFDWTDEGLLQTARAALSALGIELLDQRRFLSPWLAPAGHIAGPVPAPETAGDIARGLDVAREMARRGIGQTAVVRAGAIVAVEAMEGTDETIRRGLALAGPGAAIVKVASPSHDYRFDVPTVGAETVALSAAGRARVLAVEAGRVLLVDRAEVERTAREAGLSLVGVAESAGAG